MVDRVDMRRQLSDIRALKHLGNFEMRRFGHKQNWSIFVRGTDVRVGVVFVGAPELARCLMNVIESVHSPARDRMKQLHRAKARRATVPPLLAPEVIPGPPESSADDTAHATDTPRGYTRSDPAG
jgi:hypothetical protein